MTTIVAVLAVAALFALAGWAIPQRRSCGGSCGNCESACHREDVEDGRRR